MRYSTIYTIQIKHHLFLNHKILKYTKYQQRPNNHDKKPRHRIWKNVFSGKTQKKTNRGKLLGLFETRG